MRYIGKPYFSITGPFKGQSKYTFDITGQAQDYNGKIPVHIISTEQMKPEEMVRKVYQILS